MRKKKGSPLDALQRRDLPKLDEVKTAQQNANTGKQSHSSAATTKEPMRSSNVTLPNVMWDWIDDRHREIQRSGWHSVRKAAVIRAMVQVMMTVEVDLAGVTREEEIAERLNCAIQQSRA